MSRLLFLSPAAPDHPAWRDAGVDTMVADQMPEPLDLAVVDGVVIADNAGAEILAAVLTVLETAPAPAPFLAVLHDQMSDDGEIADAVDAALCREDLTAGVVKHMLRHAPRAAALRRQLREITAALDQAALTDDLTGLGNRALFLRELERHANIAARNDSGFVLVVADIDGLRGVNERHGQKAGDRVIAAIGARLNATLRGADMAFRVGGDEFAALITTGVNSYGVETVARRVIREMALPVDIGDTVVSVGVSIGIGFCPEHGQDGATLLRRINDALVRARVTETGFAVAELD